MNGLCFIGTLHIFLLLILKSALLNEVKFGIALCDCISIDGVLQTRLSLHQQ